MPYNQFLSLKYDTHINVEVVYLVSAVKYLYKYISKGSDCVVVRLGKGQARAINDDIEQFVNAQYIRSSEATGASFNLRSSRSIHKLPNCLYNLTTTKYRHAGTDSSGKQLSSLLILLHGVILSLM